MTERKPPDTAPDSAAGTGPNGAQPGSITRRLQALGRQTDEVASGVQATAERIVTAGRPRHAPVIAQPGLTPPGGASSLPDRGPEGLAIDGSILGTGASYTEVAKLLHWLIALLVGFLVLLGLFMKRAALSLPDRFSLYQLHKSLGLTLLALMVIRILWRLVHPPPALPASMPRMERLAARLTHFVLYALLLVLPLSGWLMVSASSLPVPTRIFGLIPVPHSPRLASLPMEARKAWEVLFKDVHSMLAYGLAALVVLHVAAALRHHLLLRDDILRRMLPGRRSGGGRVGAVAVPAAVTLLLAGSAATIAQSDPPAWRIDAARTTLAFAADAGGQPVAGKFEKVAVALAFDPDAPRAKVEVVIAIASARTGTADVDQTVADEVWLNAKGFPEARYVADAVERTADGYRLQGNLTLRGVTKPVAVPFKLQMAGKQGTFTGRLVLDRSAFAVGPQGPIAGMVIANGVTLDLALVAERP